MTDKVELEKLLGHKLVTVSKLREILKEFDADDSICVHVKGPVMGVRSMNLFAVDQDPVMGVVTLVFAEEEGKNG